MNISEIDSNFALPKIERTDIEWFDIQEMQEIVFGVFYDKKAGRYYRMPQEIGDSIAFGIAGGCFFTAGGRLRFKTNSSFIALKGVVDDREPMFHMPSTGSQGFGLYANKTYIAPLASNISWLGSSTNAKDGERAFASIRELGNNLEKEIEIYFPLYGGVKTLYVGIQMGCKMENAKEYTHKKPVVYYGSSITQGGCASHPGNDYQGHLCRWLDCDYINLGFSGNAKGEPKMAEYVAGLPASVFVLDYDCNAPSVEHLKQTHYPFYKIIRDKNPNTPIVFISRPIKSVDYVERRAVVYDTYQKAQGSGDKRVWFLDGISLFGDKDRDACTVDGVHPNDFGFYRMAEGIKPVLEEVLEL